MSRLSALYVLSITEKQKNIFYGESKRKGGKTPTSFACGICAVLCCNYPVMHAYVLNYLLDGPNGRQLGEPMGQAHSPEKNLVSGNEAQRFDDRFSKPAGHKLD